MEESRLPAPPASNTSSTGTRLATLPPSQSPQDEYDLAYGYVLRKDYALAEQAFRDSLVRVRNNGWALAGLAEVYRQKGDRRAEKAARDAAPGLAPGAWFLDLNSCAPETKRAIAAVVVYGGIMNPVSALLYARTLEWKVIAAYYVTGFPVDCVHAAATVFFLWVLAEPMLEKLDRIKVKYGLVE